jgi:hypothetical protein
MRSGRRWMARRRLDRVEVRGVAGQGDHGEPVLAGLGEGTHLPAAVGVEPVPDKDHRGVERVVRGGDQVRVVGFGHAAALALRLRWTRRR